MTASIVINLKLADVIFTAVFLIREECCCNYYNNNIDPWVGTGRPQCYQSSLNECYKCKRGLVLQIGLNHKQKEQADFRGRDVLPKVMNKLELSVKSDSIHMETHTCLYTLGAIML